MHCSSAGEYIHSSYRTNSLQIFSIALHYNLLLSKKNWYGWNSFEDTILWYLQTLNQKYIPQMCLKLWILIELHMFTSVFTPHNFLKFAFFIVLLHLRYIIFFKSVMQKKEKYLQ